MNGLKSVICLPPSFSVPVPVDVVKKSEVLNSLSFDAVVMNPPWEVENSSRLGYYI